MAVKFTPDQLLDRWEEQREIKNLMGKYVNCIILNREQDIFDLFWSKSREDLCLGLNNGYYKGSKAIKQYYYAIYKGNVLKAELLQKRFPERLGDLTKEELYGVGPFKVKPLSTPVIRIAADGETAKGLWHCQGAYADLDVSGPVSYWTWGYFAVDFIKEGEDWKIFHMLYLNDIDCICGQSWGKPQVPYPELPEFEALRDFKLPDPTVTVEVRKYYSPDRKHTLTPPVPEPYDTFSDTFSYGI